VSRLTVRIAIVVAGLTVVSTSADAQRRMRGGRAVRVEGYADQQKALEAVGRSE